MFALGKFLRVEGKERTLPGVNYKRLLRRVDDVNYAKRELIRGNSAGLRKVTVAAKIEFWLGGWEEYDVAVNEGRKDPK
jgi:hypothetical protein